MGSIGGDVARWLGSAQSFSFAAHELEACAAKVVRCQSMRRQFALTVRAGRVVHSHRDDRTSEREEFVGLRTLQGLLRCLVIANVMGTLRGGAECGQQEIYRC